MPPPCLAAGRGFDSPCGGLFLQKLKGRGRPLVELDPGPAAPRVRRHARWWDRIATSSTWDPMVGPLRRVLGVGPAGGTTAPCHHL